MKKYILVVAILLGTLSCSLHKNKKVNTDDLPSIHDIWVLREMKNTKVAAQDFREIPNLEINLRDNKINGNDGCNSYFGDINKITNTEIIFGEIASSEMYCDKMEATNQYAMLLKKVATYKRDGMKLFLGDENGKTLLTFSKVD